jgi:NAD+ synthase (glutamine-hydrolysing)
MKSFLLRGGGAYLFANQKGGDGGRLYFDGCCLICVNGELVAQGSQFSVLDVEVVAATIDIKDIHVHRQGGKAFQEQCSQQQMKPLPTIDISSRFSLLVSDDNAKGIHSALCQCLRCRVTPVLSSIRYHTPEEECVLGPACWLWDYLRRSNANGDEINLRLFLDLTLQDSFFLSVAGLILPPWQRLFTSCRILFFGLRKTEMCW